MCIETHCVDNVFFFFPFPLFLNPLGLNFWCLYIFYSVVYFLNYVGIRLKEHFSKPLPSHWCWRSFGVWEIVIVYYCYWFNTKLALSFKVHSQMAVSCSKTASCWLQLKVTTKRREKVPRKLKEKEIKAKPSKWWVS